MSKKSTNIRIISAKAKLSTTSTAIVAARPIAAKPRLGPIIAAWLGVLGLLALAGAGIYFTFKARSSFHPQATEATPQTAVVSENTAPVEIPLAPIVVSQKLPVEKPVAPAIPKVVRKPFVSEPERVTAMPKVKPETANLEKLPGEPIVSERKKPSPDPTEEPKKPLPLVAKGDVEKPKNPVVAKLPPTDDFDKDSRIEHFGTHIDFFPKAQYAYELAEKEKDKLLLIVHYAGIFQDGSFTSEKAETYRTECLSHPEVAEFLKNDFICVCQSISGTGRAVKSGSVATYICLADKTVLHVIPGPVTADEFLKQARWTLNTRKDAIAAMQKDLNRYMGYFRQAHSLRYFEEGGDDMAPRKGPTPPPPKFQPPKPPGPGGFGGFGGLGGFSDLSEQFPDFQNRLPAARPQNLPAQTQVHWLFAVSKGPLPKLPGLYQKIYEEILKEKIGQ